MHDLREIRVYLVATLASKLRNRRAESERGTRSPVELLSPSRCSTGRVTHGVPPEVVKSDAGDETLQGTLVLAPVVESSLLFKDRFDAHSVVAVLVLVIKNGMPLFVFKYIGSVN